MRFRTVAFAGVIAAIVPAAAPPEDTAQQALRAHIQAAISRTAPPPVSDDTVKRWLDAHAQALDGLRPSPLADQPWGVTALRPGVDGDPSRLHLFVFDWHKSGRLIVYGLAGGVGRGYLPTDGGPAERPIERRGRSMILDVPKEPPDPLASVIVLELSGKPETMELLTRPAADGRIRLHARDAVVHGRTLRYEPEPHKDTLGYWRDDRDWASWAFEVSTPGTYDVDTLQGCGKGSGGSTVEFSVDEKQTLKVTVQDTGHFQNFVTRRIGQFRFDQPGRYTLSVKPTHKPGVAVMDLREVTLTPQR